MTLVDVIDRRHAPPQKVAVTPGLGGSPREQLLRKITERAKAERRGGH